MKRVVLWNINGTFDLKHLSYIAKRFDRWHVFKSRRASIR